jgi:hypothetical protein
MMALRLRLSNETASLILRDVIQMSEAALWRRIDEGRERMSFAQRRLWDTISIDQEQWIHRTSAGDDRRIWL